MEIRVDKRAPEALYEQIAGAIRRAILDADLTPGTRLPATRTLAAQIGVHRNTVVAAYRRLEEEGLLRSSVGAGTFVCGPPVGGPDAEIARPRSPHRPDEELPFSWQRLLRRSPEIDPDPMELLRPSHLHMASAPILLNGAVPDSRQFPMDEFAACVQEVLGEADPQVLEYGPPEGYEALRAWLGGWLQETGVGGVSNSRVFIVSGSQHGIDLIARLVIAPGDAVVVESPTYSGATVVLREAGARLIPVPVDADGLRLDHLETCLERERPKFLYIMPCYQNPTGVSLSSARRIELLRIARRARLAIVEDHYHSALHYSGAAPRPLLADEPRGQVIHLGTFSKILFPGLRLGWMVVPEELRRSVRRLRWATDLSSGMLAQRVMERFCRSGRLANHLERLRQINGERLRAMLQALDKHFPPEARWTRPSGGMTLWAELPGTIDTLELFRAAAARGVLFTPGRAFYANGGGQSAMRLTFIREGEGRIRRGIALLGEMIRERLDARGEATDPPADAVPFL